MKLMSKIVVASLASTLTVSAMAEVSQPSTLPVAQTADLSYAFGDSQNLQVQAMTVQEMDETQGAWVPAAIAGARLFVSGARWAAPHVVRGAKYAAPHAGVGAAGGAASHIGNKQHQYQPITSKGVAKAAAGGAVGGVVSAPIRSKWVSTIVGGYAGGSAEGWMNRRR